MRYESNSTVLRHLGFCPVCQRDIKIRGNRLVHHGYERPGEGYIVGDCFAVDMPPHELSSETAVAYQRSVVTPAVQKAEREVETLKLDPEWMLFERWEPKAQGASGRSGYVTVQLTRSEVSAYDWNQKLTGLRYKAQRYLDDMLTEQRRVQTLIDTWQPQPLREVEEEERREEQSRAERKAIVDAKRAAEAAKKAAYSAAAEARDAKRHALLQAFDAEFDALLRRPQGVDREEAALLLLQESRKKDHKLDYPNDWFKVGGYNEADAAHRTLIELGLTGPSRGAGYRAPVLTAREVSARLKTLRGF